METSRAPLGYRHLVAFMGFLSFFFLNIQCLSTSFAIVAMVNYTPNQVRTITSASNFTICPTGKNATSDTTTGWKMEGGLNWTPQTQGYVIGVYYFGRLAALLPSSKLAQLFQAKRVALYGCILTTLVTFMVPMASIWHVYFMMLVQLIRGIGEGCILTSFYVLMANWFPREERGLLSTFVLSGFTIGAVCTCMVSGWICDHLEWPALFYMSGCFGLLLSLLLSKILHETPRSCPRISERELKYLARNEEDVEIKKVQRTPWRKILTSIPVYALMFGLFGQFWTFTYFWTVQTTFLGSIHHFSFTQNGYFSALPFVSKAIGEGLTSAFTHWLTKKKYVGINMLRKGCTLIACVGFSLSFVGIYFAKCDGYVAAAFSLVAMLFVGVSTLGAGITCMDMSPRFAGSLSGMLNTIGSCSSFLLPVVVGKLTKNQTLEEWHSVFFLSIAVVMGCGLVFAIFGSAEVQPWNFVPNGKDTTLENGAKKNVIKKGRDWDNVT